jgi:hypothetical protein
MHLHLTHYLVKVLDAMWCDNGRVLGSRWTEPDRRIGDQSKDELRFAVAKLRGCRFIRLSRTEASFLRLPKRDLDLRVWNGTLVAIMAIGSRHLSKQTQSRACPLSNRVPSARVLRQPIRESM